MTNEDAAKFYKALEALCHDYDVILGHEEGHGTFLIREADLLDAPRVEGGKAFLVDASDHTSARNVVRR